VTATSPARFTTHTDDDDRCAVLDAVQEVIVLCSSSRGGSSLLFRALAQSKQLLSPRGEEAVFLKLAPSVRTSVDDAQPDKLSDTEVATIRTALANDIGVGAPNARTRDIGRYIRDLAVRLPLQWPGLVRAEDVVKAYDVLVPEWSTGEQSDGLWEIDQLFRAIVGRLEADRGVDHRYYDRDPLCSLAVPTDSDPAGPPDGGRFIEEPPFIPVLARDVPVDGIWPTKLLLKSPSSCHRLELFHQLFPGTRVRILHLIRNPGAAVNGLIDGWRHWGFYSRDAREHGHILSIPGYSDRVPGGTHWWNFDAPAGWSDYACEPLADVCAFQWGAAHRAVAQYVRRHQADYHRVDFADLIEGPAARGRAIAGVCEFLGISDPTTGGRWPGVLMATTAPAAGRWRRREDEIGEAIRRRAGDVATTLDFEWARRESWT
jgi:hypothetical protein